MGRKPTGNPSGRPKKKPTNTSLHLSWEMQAVPHQSDLHHSLYDIAAAFEAGPEWFNTVEIPLKDILGEDTAAKVKTGNWQADGRDFYALVEKWIERTAFDENKGTEATFMSSIVKNCARGFVNRNRDHLNELDVGEIIGRAFEKIIVAGKYDPTGPVGRKITYLKTTAYSAGRDLMRERMPKGEGKKEGKPLTARSTGQTPSPPTYTVEDFLVDLNLEIKPRARKKAA